MEVKDPDFIRNPVVQNQVFFLELKCALCGFSTLTRSIEELIEHEKLHRTQCARSDAAAARRRATVSNCRIVIVKMLSLPPVMIIPRLAARRSSLE